MTAARLIAQGGTILPVPPLDRVSLQQPRLALAFCVLMLQEYFRQGLTTIDQASLHLMILLPQPPVCWDCRHVVPHLTSPNV